MKIEKWMTINKNGTSRLTSSKPALQVDEISVLLSLVIPDALFRRPHLQAEITIPDDASMPQYISSEVQTNLAECIKQVTGLDMKITVSNPTDSITEEVPVKEVKATLFG